MKSHIRLLSLPCLALTLGFARPMVAARGWAQAKTPLNVSFCELLANPAAYSGRFVAIAVHIHIFKEGASLSSPECSKKTIWLLIESKSGPGILELARRISPHPYYARGSLRATLTGTLHMHHYDEITHRTRPVFMAIAAKDIKYSCYRNHK